MEDLTGKRFGRLTVTELKGRNAKRREFWWTCLCDCGNIKVIRGDNLKDGTTRSCGCLKKERDRTRWLKAPGEGSANQIINSYKGHAKNRGLSLELTREQIINIMNKDCYYCGKEPSNIYKSPYNTGDFVYNGIDRIDNSKGYTIENAVPCCGTCNHSKDILSENDFLLWVKRVYEFRNLSDFPK
jgi:hypothetical protein